MRKIISFVVIAAIMCGVFVAVSGCESKQQTPGGQESDVTLIKVAFWGSPEEIEIITDSIKDWEETHPHIKVRFEHTPYGAYESKILTRVAGKVAPDVICTEVNHFVTFATEGVLYDLSEFIAKDTEFDLNDFFPQEVARFTREGDIYVIPRDTAPFACVFYNKDLFDQAGIEYPSDDWTWEDMLEKAKALTKIDESGRVFQYGFYGWAWQNFVYGNGGNIVDDINNPTKCTLDDPRAIEGLRFYADLINKYHVMPTPVALTNFGMGVDYMFSTGRLAMFLSGIWETPRLRNYEFRWDVAMFPKNKEGVRRFGTGGSGYAIMESSEQKEAAWEVVKALTAPKAQIKLAEMGLAQPARRSIAESDHFATHPLPPANKGMLNEAVQYAVYDPFHPKWREANARHVVPALELVFNGKETPEEAVKKIIPRVNELLQKEQ